MGSYYGALAYADLKEKMRVMKRYRKECTEATAESFCSYALELSDAATDSRRQKHQA